MNPTKLKVIEIAATLIRQGARITDFAKIYRGMSESGYALSPNKLDEYLDQLVKADILHRAGANAYSPGTIMTAISKQARKHDGDRLL